MKKKLIMLSGLVLALAPVAAWAQTVVTCNALRGTIGFWVCEVGRILNAIIPVLVTLAIVVFIWGVISYVIAQDEEAKTKGRDRMIYGIIGMAVIVAIWGLVAVLDRTFGIGVGTAIPALPTIPLQ